MAIFNFSCKAGSRSAGQFSIFKTFCLLPARQCQALAGGPIAYCLRRRRRSGYTLIELLVGLSIIGLVFGIGFVSYREFSRRQTLISASRKLSGALRLAQEQALAGKKPEGCSGLLDGYKVYINPSDFRVSATCPSDVEVKTAEEYGSEITRISGPSQIFFKSIGHGTDLSSDAIITLRQESTGNTIDITVTQGGEIR